MKILATKKFEDKLNAMGQPYKDAFSYLLQSLKDFTPQQAANHLGVQLVRSIQFYKLGTLRTFLNFTNDINNELVLVFLDLTQNIAPINNIRNPRYNNLINPRYNNLINPRYNSNFSGFYYYDLNGTPFEFVIQESNQNSLIFYDFSGEQTKYAIKHGQNGYVVFDLNNEWVGHLESDSRTGFNYFDLNNEWIGFLK